MLRKSAIAFTCLLISFPVSAASVASRETLVVDGELVKSGGRTNHKAWGQSTVEVRAEDGEAKVIAVSQELDSTSSSNAGTAAQSDTSEPTTKSHK